MAHRSLDRLDKKILHLISEDARIPFLEVARACNVSGAAIHQRIQKLTNLGVLKGSQFVIDPERIGYDVVDALKQIPEIVECHYTTGEYDLFLKMYAYNNHHLMSIIHDKLMPLGLSRSESSISYNAVIDRALPIEGMRVADTIVIDDDDEDDE